MSEPTAATLATDRVRSVQRRTEQRVELATEFYDRPGLRGYERAELSFLRWEIARGVLQPLDADRPGSPWWRGVNDRLLRDKTEARLLHDGHRGAPSAASVEHWLRFRAAPAPGSWYRAHNASIVAGYLEHEELARREAEVERFMMNIALARVLFTHAMVARPGFGLGIVAILGPRLADPRGGSVSLFLDLRGSYPDEYPLTGMSVGRWIAREGRIAQALDNALISPRLEQLYAFSAAALGEPRLERFLDDGVPCYARAPLTVSP